MSADSQQQLWDLIDGLIEQANQSCDQGLEPGEAHQALMYAAARYAAFVAAASSESRKDFLEDVSDAKKFYLDQFRQLLHENFDDYVENFKVYTATDDDETAED